MGLREMFGLKPKQVEQVRQRANPVLSYEITGSGTPLGKQLGATQLRKGMWVRYEGRTGIATAIVPAQIGAGFLVNVDIVDDKTGHTTMSVTAPLEALCQADHDEIPEVRRPHEHISRKLGYLV